MALSLHPSDKIAVIMFHGIGLNHRHLKPLETFLSQAGYAVYNLDYPSTKRSLEDLSDLMFTQIAPILGHHSKINFIGFSMGGLLIRALLNKHTVPNLQAVIMLGTPNNGSEVANFWKNKWIYKKIFGPAGQQLTTDQATISDLLGRPSYPLGIIAGTSAIDIFSGQLLPKPHDGKVSVSSTKLPEMTDHTTVATSHTFMPWNKKVHQKTLNFLQHHRF